VEIEYFLPSRVLAYVARTAALALDSPAGRSTAPVYRRSWEKGVSSV